MKSRMFRWQASGT